MRRRNDSRSAAPSDCDAARFRGTVKNAYIALTIRRAAGFPQQLFQ